jgi:hypothetical protein
MYREYFRIGVGTLILITHIGCIGIIFFFKSNELGLEKENISLLLLPITAAYVVAVVGSAIENQSTLGVGQRVNLFYSIVVTIVTLAVSVALLYTVVNISSATEEVKRQILIFETAFGGAFGLIVTDLFGQRRDT